MTSRSVWVLRAAWTVVPLVAGSTFADALDPRSAAVRTVASIGLWVVWALALGALLVPRTTSLTGVRVVVPAGVAGAAWAATVVPEPGLTEAAALGSTTLAAALVLTPVVGQVFVNGSSYGEERRLPLRVPAALLLGPLPLAWLAVVAGATAGPMLLAAGRWAVGAVALAIGAPAAVVAARALHQLARRWVVLVPAGVVLHDPFALTDPVLVPRRTVRRLRPAPASSEALDLTQGAPGLAVELVATEPLALGVTGARRRESRTVDADRFLFTPSRPGVLLAEAEQRRIPVG